MVAGGRERGPSGEGPLGSDSSSEDKEELIAQCGGDSKWAGKKSFFNQRRRNMQRPCGRRQQSQFEALKGGHVAEPRTHGEIW